MILRWRSAIAIARQQNVRISHKMIYKNYDMIAMISAQFIIHIQDMMLFCFYGNEMCAWMHKSFAYRPGICRNGFIMGAQKRLYPHCVNQFGGMDKSSERPGPIVGIPTGFNAIVATGRFAKKVFISGRQNFLLEIFLPFSSAKNT